MILNDHTASILLAKWFMQDVRQLSINSKGQVDAAPAYKHAVIEDAYNLLGVLDFFDLKQKIRAHDGTKSSVYNLSTYLGYNPAQRRRADELIQLGGFYIHPRLQETPPRRRVFIDYETMEQKREDPAPFYLEIVDSFTVQDVLSYYYLKHEMSPLPGNAHLTQMENLSSSYDPDTLLYLIDASAYALTDGGDVMPAQVPAFLPNHLNDAEILIERRENTLKEGGLMQIVPRPEYFETN